MATREGTSDVDPDSESERRLVVLEELPHQGAAVVELCNIWKKRIGVLWKNVKVNVVPFDEVSGGSVDALGY